MSITLFIISYVLLVVYVIYSMGKNILGDHTPTEAELQWEQDMEDYYKPRYWADVANEYLPEVGVRGGAKTRVYKDDYMKKGVRGLHQWFYLCLIAL